jgi:hypothetical protein
MRSTFRSLKETFPTHLRIAEAPAEYIARPIRRWPVEPEGKGDPRSSRYYRGKVWRADAQAVAQDERRGCRGLFVDAAGGRQESGAMRIDVFAGQAGFPRGYALLANRPASRLGQADAKRQALRTARHGSPAI